MTEGAGGLFDFNATLPLMAMHVIVLMVVLTFIFYKPVSKVLDEREAYISGNLSQASEKLIKADELYKQYDEQVKFLSGYGFYSEGLYTWSSAIYEN